jgi:hypothetical protein
MLSDEKGNAWKWARDVRGIMQQVVGVPRSIAELSKLPQCGRQLLPHRMS